VSFPPDSDPHDRPAAERVVPEILRRVIEAGTRNLGPEGLRQMLSELKLPREALSYTLSQLDETKNGVYRAISKELRELFEKTSLSEELARALSLLTLEVKMEVRFKPSSLDGKGLDASVRFKRNTDTHPEKQDQSDRSEAADRRASSSQPPSRDASEPSDAGSAPSPATDTRP
jgi:hypothetical protein